MKIPKKGVLLTIVLSASGFGGALGDERACDTVVGLLATEFIYKEPNSRLARVDIRQCSPEGSSTIQLAAWREGELRPALIVNTDDFGVVQVAARANVFIIETSGGTRDQVFVIQYVRGEPKLILRRTTKGTARITITGRAVDLVIEGIFAGDEPPRTEVQHYTLDMEALRPR